VGGQQPLILIYIYSKHSIWVMATNCNRDIHSKLEKHIYIPLKFNCYLVGTVDIRFNNGTLKSLGCFAYIYNT